MSNNSRTPSNNQNQAPKHTDPLGRTRGSKRATNLLAVRQLDFDQSNQSVVDQSTTADFENNFQTVLAEFSTPANPSKTEIVNLPSASPRTLKRSAQQPTPWKISARRHKDLSASAEVLGTPSVPKKHDGSFADDSISNISLANPPAHLALQSKSNSLRKKFLKALTSKRRQKTFESEPNLINPTAASAESLISNPENKSFSPSKRVKNSIIERLSKLTDLFSNNKISTTRKSLPTNAEKSHVTQKVQIPNETAPASSFENVPQNIAPPAKFTLISEPCNTVNQVATGAVPKRYPHVPTVGDLNQWARDFALEQADALKALKQNPPQRDNQLDHIIIRSTAPTPTRPSSQTLIHP